MLLDSDIPLWLEHDVQRAVGMCPALALRVTTGVEETSVRRF
jgi:hypothetical protein